MRWNELGTLHSIFKNVKRDPKFELNIRAVNSKGEGPIGNCVVDTTTIYTGTLRVSPNSEAGYQQVMSGELCLGKFCLLVCFGNVFLTSTLQLIKITELARPGGKTQDACLAIIALIDSSYNYI